MIVTRGGFRIDIRVLLKFYKKKTKEHRNDVICRKIMIQPESTSRVLITVEVQI